MMSDLSYLLVAVAGTISIMLLALALFVGLSHAKSQIKWSFALMCIPLAIWVMSNALADIDISMSLLWSRIAFASAAIALASLAVFTIWFPRRINSSPFAISSGILIVALIFAVISMTEAIVPSVEVTNGYANVVAGKAFDYYVIYAVLSVILSVSILLMKLKSEKGIDRERVKFVLIGTTITAIIAIITNLVLPLITGTNPLALYGSFATLVFIAMVAFSIIKHRLFSVRVATARAVAYLLSGVTLGVGFGVILYSVDGIIFGAERVSIVQQMFYVFSAVVIGFMFPSIKDFFDKLTRRIFLRDVYDPEEVLTNIASIVAVTKTSQVLLKKVSNELYQQLNLSFVEAYISTNEKWTRKTRVGSVEINNQVINIDEIVKNNPSVVINLENTNEGSERSEDIAMFLILRTPQGMVGYFVIGYKRSGVGFSTGDTAMLEAIANEIAIATENYLRLEAIESFNDTLQQKVKDATGELRTSNKKLRTLDESKDEFISMASHQLRTPLTSVKGYLSMVLEGDMGEITTEQRKVLEEAYNSSQRMVYLIGDFLNVSRLQTGKFELEKSEVQLPLLINDELAQLKAAADSRGTTLNYEQPDSFPKVSLDENKIRQVMMNFIDNAIYYAKPGGGSITIVLAKYAHHISFKVIDNGIGVPKGERHQLFSKFYRASNAKKARPDGTGIGLFMAKKVIVAHGGAIIFESVEGQGSTFGFRLPLENNAK